ncbi:glycoside hydrolase family 43 protein [Aaosphaeria arxii CBS 175.79]|uniref:Glycoside hydrolase family 43 protein n=1 Tax=Aaosphaeria arxii CBS 175.79 TaxID=1450172 RepID=A0A6A5XS51_9PLEO|nr:glycoside hydrolase family 43 protein [Aaosphaeria arxii CBS 175.79]KAF2015637.1 glycoside hydrolase family 43 protein [Aaosphaeria arxii CBS 175.79]
MATERATFTNPIIRGFNPDPTVCVVPATPTTPRRYFISTSTFEYFPGCAIYVSEDIVNWKLIGHALNRRSQIDLRTVEPGAGSWASTLRYRPNEKRWYLINGLFHRYQPTTDERIFPRGFYVYTDDIYDDNAWSDPVYFDNPGFDQDVFWDDDTGKVYLSTTVRLANRTPGLKLKDFAIHASEIDIKTGRTLTPPVVLRQSPYGVAEGSHIMRKGDYYYMFVAEGGTEAGHQEWVFRSTEGPLGPWESQGQPLWYNGPDEEVQRTGHADVFEDDQGKWWGVFLGVRPAIDGGRYIEPQLGRETFLVKVDWVDDWPVFNDGKNITLETEAHYPLNQLEGTGSSENLRWKASYGLDSAPEALELGWYQKNTPIKSCYSLHRNPDYIRLYGNCYSPSSPECPAMLLRKQKTYNETFHTKLRFNPSRAGYEAGVTVWWSMYSHASIGITAAISADTSPSSKQIVCRLPTGKAGNLKEIVLLHDSDETSALGNADEVTITAKASPTKYILTIAFNNITKDIEFDAEKLTVAPPVGGAFTGTMWGIYSFGQWEPVLDPADFSDIYVE